MHVSMIVTTFQCLLASTARLDASLQKCGFAAIRSSHRDGRIAASAVEVLRPTTAATDVRCPTRP
ncbi:UNVERIFIED_CONTAM: hypothetical protein NY603_36305, partial [Bacteroidetes bacterium 56_B9]